MGLHVGTLRYASGAQASSSQKGLCSQRRDMSQSKCCAERGRPSERAGTALQQGLPQTVPPRSTADAKARPLQQPSGTNLEEFMSDTMQRWAEEMKDGIEVLKTMKDELKVQIHLASMEAKERFTELEQRIDNEQLTAKKNLKELTASFKTLKDELGKQKHG